MYHLLYLFNVNIGVCQKMLARQLWTGELGNKKDIVCIRVAWCWRQTEGAREVMAYLVVHITISSIKDLSIYVMHTIYYRDLLDEYLLALPLAPPVHTNYVNCAILPSLGSSIYPMDDVQIAPYFPTGLLSSPLPKQQLHLLNHHHP